MLLQALRHRADLIVLHRGSLIDAQLIAAADLELFDYADSAEEACAIIHRKLPK